MDLLGIGLGIGEVAEGAAPGAGLAETLSMILPFGVLIVGFYFFLIRPQKKREKETDKMRKAVEVGDKLVTIGGLIGKVVNIKDDEITIECGVDKTKIRIMRWAIQTREPRDDTARGYSPSSQSSELDAAALDAAPAKTETLKLNRDKAETAE